jgi:hypothetical protein
MDSDKRAIRHTKRVKITDVDTIVSNFSEGNEELASAPLTSGKMPFNFDTWPDVDKYTQAPTTGWQRAYNPRYKNNSCHAHPSVMGGEKFYWHAMRRVFIYMPDRSCAKRMTRHKKLTVASQTTLDEENAEINRLREDAVKNAEINRLQEDLDRPAAKERSLWDKANKIKNELHLAMPHTSVVDLIKAGMGEVQLPLNSDLNWHQNADAVLAKLGADDRDGRQY